MALLETSSQHTNILLRISFLIRSCSPHAFQSPHKTQRCPLCSPQSPIPNLPSPSLAAAFDATAFHAAASLAAASLAADAHDAASRCCFPHCRFPTPSPTALTIDSVDRMHETERPITNIPSAPSHIAASPHLPTQPSPSTPSIACMSLSAPSPTSPPTNRRQPSNSLRLRVSDS